MKSVTQFEILGTEGNFFWRLRDSDGTIRAVPSQKFATEAEVRAEIKEIMKISKTTRIVKLNVFTGLIDSYVRLAAALAAGTAVTKADLDALIAQANDLNAA